MRIVRRTVVVLLGSLVIVLGGASMAAAHTGTSAAAGPDGTTRITWSFNHGCSGRATIGLRAQLPAGAWNVTAQDPPGWTSTVTATEIHWTGGQVPDGTTASFTASMVLAQPAGETVGLANVQECTDGAEIAWIQPPSAGDATEDSRPMPTIVVPANPTRAPVTTTSAVAASTTVAASTPGTARMATNANAVTQEGSPTNRVGTWVFLGVCGAIGGVALVLFVNHRRSKQG